MKTTLQGNEYFRYVLDEGEVVDQLTSKPNDIWTCITKDLKEIIESDYYAKEYQKKMQEIITKPNLAKEDIQNLVKLEILHDTKQVDGKYLIVKAIRRFVYEGDTHWEEELSKARKIDKELEQERKDRDYTAEYTCSIPVLKGGKRQTMNSWIQRI